MIALTVKKIADKRWHITNADGRGFSDLVAICKLADVPVPRGEFRARREAVAKLDSITRMASARTGGAYEYVSA